MGRERGEQQENRGWSSAVSGVVARAERMACCIVCLASLSLCLSLSVLSLFPLQSKQSQQESCYSCKKETNRSFDDPASVNVTIYCNTACRQTSVSLVLMFRMFASFSSELFEAIVAN